MLIVDYHNRINVLPILEARCNDLLNPKDFDSSVNTVLWGKLPFYSSIVGDLMYREESHLWERLFTKRSCDFLRPVNYFDNLTEWKQELKLVKPSARSESVIEMMNQILRHRQNYLDFLDIFHDMATEEDIHYEMFQKSFFYEIFFYLLKKESLVSRPIFLAICKKFMGWEINEKFNSDIIEFYSHKYAYQIIPRRHGKTFMTGSAFAALLFTFLTSGLRLGYYSHTKDLSQSVKSYVITKCKEWSQKLNSRYNIATPTDSVVVKLMSDLNTAIFTTADDKDDDFNCCAKFKSARNDNALRGDDLNLLIVDEAFAINKNRFGTILAHGQKADNKIIFLTSPVNHKVEEMKEISRSLKCRNDINFYHVYYFCNNPEHLKYASRYPACPRLTFYKPDHININETNRFLTNLLAQSESSYEDELGIAPMAQFLNGNTTCRFCPFSERFLTYLKNNVNIINDSTCVSDIFIYLDPNYCDSLTSGIALVASGLTREKTPCIMYLDHKFIDSEDLGKVTEIIVRMLLHCIRHIAFSSSNKRSADGASKSNNRRFFLAVENNNQRNNCTLIYEKLRDCFRSSDIQVYLYYTPVEDKMTKQMKKRAGYTLLNKFTIFSQTIQFINEKLVWFSKLLHSYYLHQAGKNEIEYLRQNLSVFKFSPQEKKFSGKSNSTTDDLVVAKVMSIYLARTYDSAIRSENWLSVSPWTLISRN